MKRDEIVLLLPEIFRRTYKQNGPAQSGNVLSALLGVMERLHERDETILEELYRYFDPDQVPVDKADEFLPFLARWVDLDWLLPESGEYEAGLDCLRNLILSAPQLASMRGTHRGLEQFLETATGQYGFQVEESRTRPFYIIIRCPPGARPLEKLVKRIADGEKPAYVRCKLDFYEQAHPAGSRDPQVSGSPVV